MCPDAKEDHPANDPWDYVRGGVPEGMLTTRRMAEALASRRSTLWLLGDSVTQQHLRALQCRAFDEEVPVTTLPTVALPGKSDANFLCSGIAGARVCHGRGFYAYGPSNDDLGIQYIDDLLKEGKRQIIKPHDVVVFNLGVHYMPSAAAKAVDNLHLVAAQLQALGREQPLPCIMWRSVTPQHFPTPDGLWLPCVNAAQIKTWPKAPDPMHPCRSRVDSAPRWADARRAMLKLDAVAERAGWPILRVWEAGAERGADHVGRWRTSHVGEPGYDCTHFCEPSSFLRFSAEELVLAVNQHLRD
jgi:hypothetical protein